MSLIIKQESPTDYFLAGRHVGWFVIGASIFASNIGSEHIVGLAGTAAKSGVVMGHLELHSWLVFLLGLFFKRINARGAMAALVSGFHD
jgi:SSS family solute:Na+ symporter